MSGLLTQQTPSAAPQVPARPPFDPSFKNASGFADFTDELKLEAVRGYSSADSAEAILNKFPHLSHVEYNIPAVNDLDNSSTVLSIFPPKSSTNTKRSVVYYIHGGGQVSGNRFSGFDSVISLLPSRDDVMFATIGYRLAPEHRAPAGAYDCGSPLAAATCILTRNLKYPQIRAQMLVVPMIDDRDDTGVSWKQFDTGTLWPGKSNRMAWEMVLGPERGGPHVSEIQCPARTTDLSNLPPAFIDVGEYEVFRDGAVAYASRIRQSGSTAELHVWPGVYHGAPLLEDTPVTRAMVAAQKEYVIRMLELCED
ncbi:hypothetical protein PHISCL_05043 [Aspergillus sclerotialis]|uniref:Alpha/beta hydrolase fold-3 domain-containing protein n=1 Tax=Aspergillus sclerotialis TaxID=2070753 RepID=A0A3A2ZJ89_9EURO|nr:hypothetical protein PHISCL_05043 [Aspergillus sclerotialis]